MRRNDLNHNPEPEETPRERTPVDKVLAVFGSAKAGALVGLTTEAVRKWNRRVSKGGQGGLVPSRFQHVYLAEAREQGLALAPEDFIAEPII